tara:strand:+ start:79 stop:1380 length:1302 start_codon:yes stop_codon:yes gene_type:complete
MATEFDYLNNLVTTNPDGTVTVGGVTYASDGSGIIENYGAVSDAQEYLDSGADTIADTLSGDNTYLESLGYVYNPATKSYGLPPEPDLDLDSNLDSNLDLDSNSITLPGSTAQEIANALVDRGLGSTADFFLQGSTNLDDIIARYGGDESFMDLVNRYDPTTMPEFTGNYTYNPYNQGFGAGTGRNQVYYIDPTTGKAAMGLASEVNALYPGIETFAGIDAFSAANPDPTLFDPIEDTTTDNTTESINYEQLYNDLLAQQNQPQTDYSGLMGLLNQFMQSRNSLQGAGRYNNMYGTMYGGGMGYGSPFNSGYGYGYGMNPYAGGIGSFYGNTGLGFSPSGYSTGYGSGYGMNNMFYGGFGGNNYNQMAYNPYSSLYNQLSNPQTYGYSGDVYTPEYSSYLNTPFEGDRYSQGYQDYLQQNNPGVYTNLFGGAV